MPSKSAARYARFTLSSASSRSSASRRWQASLSSDRIAGARISTLLPALASVGVLFALYLSYLQVGVIGALCFWCVVSALLELGIWGMALLDRRLMRG